MWSNHISCIGLRANPICWVMSRLSILIYCDLCLTHWSPSAASLTPWMIAECCTSLSNNNNNDINNCNCSYTVVLLTNCYCLCRTEMCGDQEDQTWALRCVIYHVKSVRLHLQDFTLEQLHARAARLVVTLPMRGKLAIAGEVVSAVKCVVSLFICFGFSKTTGRVATTMCV